MTSFAVIAELPMGVYRGRTPGGSLDPLPSPTRLHAALLCAAASGPRAELVDDELRPSASDVAALHWLEEHSPDGVRLPRTAEVRTPVYGYRREGTLLKEGGDAGPKDKVVMRPLVGLVAVAGPFAWTWDDAPPAEVGDALAAMCSDVAHLGNAETPVRMRVGEATPTHRRAVDASLFTTPAGLDVDVPSPGRTTALVANYGAGRRRPTAAADRYSPTSDTARTADEVTTAREVARYLSTKPDGEPDGPWSTVLLAGFGLPHDARLRPVDHVGWAVAVHRALISLVGDGAPAVLTGNYEPGVSRPANRVALQLLPANVVPQAAIDHDGPVLAALLPSGIDGGDAAAVAGAFDRLRRVSWGKSVRTVTPLRPRSARTFWPDGSGEIFDVHPAAVPDTRPLRRDWSIADAVALSLGFVLRCRVELHGQGRGDRRHRDTARRVQEAGLRVLDARRIVRGDLTRYVHRIGEGRIVQPYTARLSLGGLLDERVLLCLGQSRHVGGGLLVPAGASA